jgi:hypothetical protein
MKRRRLLKLKGIWMFFLLQMQSLARDELQKWSTSNQLWQLLGITSSLEKSFG